MFSLYGGAINWKSFKQQIIANSVTEAEYIAASEATKETIWMKFTLELGVVLKIEQPVPLYCDNTGAVAQAKELRSHHKSKYILRWFYLIQKIIERCDVIIEWVNTKNNIVNPFTKALSIQYFDHHLNCMGIKYRGDWL